MRLHKLSGICQSPRKPIVWNVEVLEWGSKLRRHLFLKLIPMKIQICQVGEIPKLGKQIVAQVSGIKIRAVSNLWRYPSTKTIFHFLSQEGRARKLVLFHWEQQHQQSCHALPWILAMTQIRNCRKASKPWAFCSSQSRKGLNRWLQQKQGLKWWGSEAYILIWLLFILMNFMRGRVCWANLVPKSQWSKRFWSFESHPISWGKMPENPLMPR